MLNLSRLAIGSLALTPSFDGNTTSYTVTTTNATNTITAIAVDSSATVSIDVDGTSYDSGDSVTWDSGENAVTVTVSKGGASKVYTVTVTKE